MYNITYVYMYINTCTGRPSVLQSMGSQRVGHDWVTEQHEHICMYIYRIFVELLLNGRHDVTLLLSSPGNNDILKKIIIKNHTN